MTIVQGWERDYDEWWRRPVRRADTAMIIKGEHAHDRFLCGGPEYVWHQISDIGGGWLIGSGMHGFVELGYLYCRNAKQKRRLDQGLWI